MRIVSFTGPKGSGKDTAAALLAEAGVSKGKISFAGPMKEILSKVLAIDLEVFEHPVLKEKPFVAPIFLTETLVLEIADEMRKVLPKSEYRYPDFANIPEQTLLTSPRQALQFIGTEFIRKEAGADWHVAAAFRKAALEKLDPNGLYCVTDARFPNEYEWLKNRFGDDFVGFYVERPEAEEMLASATHMSELAVKEVRKLIPEDRILKNDRSIYSLRAELTEKLNLNTLKEKLNV